MPFRTDDPVRDFERWDAEQERRRELHFLCRCSQCGEAVYDYDDYYDFDGDKVHEDCAMDWIAQFKR